MREPSMVGSEDRECCKLVYQTTCQLAPLSMDSGVVNHQREIFEDCLTRVIRVSRVGKNQIVGLKF